MVQPQPAVKVLTDNTSEIILAKWDGERFALVYVNKALAGTKTIILNPKEMMKLIEFAGKLGKYN